MALKLNLKYQGVFSELTNRNRVYTRCMGFVDYAFLRGDITRTEHCELNQKLFDFKYYAGFNSK